MQPQENILFRVYISISCSDSLFDFKIRVLKLKPYNYTQRAYDTKYLTNFSVILVGFQCWFKAGPTSATLAQHLANSGSTSGGSGLRLE